MAHHLIYHPRREEGTFDGTTVHYDKTRGNQDPYVWSTRFLHTYCHATELRHPKRGDINFWVSADCLSKFTWLTCDLVFEVEQVHIWRERNEIDEDDAIVDSPQAYLDHYRWAHQHKYEKRQRRTLKAHSMRSFQPQHQNGSLVDILPFLGARGLGREELMQRMTKGYASKPAVIEDGLARDLKAHLEQVAFRAVRGDMLERIRQARLELASMTPLERKAFKTALRLKRRP